MAYLKIVPYIYLAAGIFFIYSAIMRYTEGDQGWWLWVLIGALSIFMFFFRMRFAKKFQDRSKQDKP